MSRRYSSTHCPSYTAFRLTSRRCKARVYASAPSALVVAIDGRGGLVTQIPNLVLAASIALDIFVAGGAIILAALGVRWFTRPRDTRLADPRVRPLLRLTLALLFASYALVIVHASLHLSRDLNAACPPLPEWP